MAEEETAFSKLPPRLQENFFELAEKASLKVYKKLVEEKKAVAELGKHLRFRKVPRREVKGLRIGVVDGSSSPKLSERLGYRVGVYTASYMVFENDQIISDEDDESMEAGYIMSPQIGSSLHTRKILSLLCTLLERDLAIKCLEKYDVDLMVIDGSFYGFRARCSEIKAKDLNDLDVIYPGNRALKRGWDLIKEVYELSKKLKRCGKAVAIIKRLRTAAIDGWLLTRSWDPEKTLKKNDRLILKALMKPGEYFDYMDLLDNRWSYLHYSSLKTWFDEIKRKEGGRFEKLSGDEKLEYAFEYVHKKLRTQIVTDLAVEKSCAESLVKEVTSPQRLYVKCSALALPTCVELGDGVDRALTLSYILSDANPATGLPFPLDLADENISLDRRMAIEFAEEIEARLLLNRELEADLIHGEFASINPQKEE